MTSKKVYIVGSLIKHAEISMGSSKKEINLIDDSYGNIGMVAVFSNKKKAYKYAKVHGIEVYDIIEMHMYPRQ